ncbi:DNA gyrase subunit A [Francisella tularensis]|uniref:DNA gyrase subunit A n=1 Tax=Francisella tularensis TaxID=263 RepID=UPI0000E26BCA|nr:DNA gyrase subunit A [Francisella tularensis]ABI82508.1 DNA topoisomerase (ATP-hydrolyzing) [Francisella tularensis subsp. holarctica OSU18]AJI64388.1 DNA gyrase, A subunit [Francisella tularensis subsp. holarctica]AZP06231.1 DNA gyrase subunit A [Francisella tularensis]MBD1287174.1 DNA gyrase subunit A [Francisella tularensis subsp. holarctica]MBD1308223.1 DNA gyrase subunit A [Francisella tularensis subsp. holarctica]
MSIITKESSSINIEKELKQSYLDYAMSVIVGRALPDVRDGLKPVHRRVLFAMNELSNYYNRPYKKSARVVGDVIGKYHPHGDTAVYDTIVRMAQPFSLRYTLVDGQGNFGSVDGDSPAAMRYTEIRMEKLTHELLIDIDKETVDFSPNYDNTELVPDVLPTRVPNLLVNGSSGIAVGMATNIPPHNMTEVINGTIALIDNPNLTIEELIEYIPAPDFPTGSYINGTDGILEAYKTGRGRVIMRAKADIHEDEASGKAQIIVTEIPYQVNKAKLVEKIAELVKDKKVAGISELRDESDKDGIRVVIDLKRDESPEVVLNTLYAQTQLQCSFGINMVALSDNRPKLLNLKEILEQFIKHRKEVVTRRTIFELRKSKERAHILEGLLLSLANIDEMIELIKASPSPADAKESMLARSWNGSMVKSMLEGVDVKMYRKETLASYYGIQVDSSYNLTEEQADAILALRLHRLTGLEQDKIVNEFKELIDRIKYLISILSDIKELICVVKDELVEIRDNYGDQRKSEIIESRLDLTREDLIAEEDMVVTLSMDGYVKTQPLSMYNAQKRGGVGKSATKTKEEDSIFKLMLASTHDTMLCFSSLGRVYWSKVYDFPVASRISKGRPINNILPLEKDERITAMMPISQFNEGWYVFMATKLGRVKKVDLSEFARPRSTGKIAIGLNDGDELSYVALTDGNKQIMMFSDAGKAIRFDESDVRAMGRSAAGVTGMRLHHNQKIVSVIVTNPDEGIVLAATENGYGKRTAVSEYRKTKRASQGVIAISTSERNGKVVVAVLVENDEDIVMITDNGTLVRTSSDEVRECGRSAQGVRLINLRNNEKLISLKVVKQDDVEDNQDIENNEDIESSDVTVQSE